MNDNRIEKYPEFSGLFSVIPFQPRSAKEEDGTLIEPENPCPLCGINEGYFRYDEDFGCYLCAKDYYGMYWNPEAILETDHFEEGHFLPGIHRQLLYQFITMLDQKTVSAKFDHLEIIEVE
ncbi:MAG: hypothetical protein AB7V07_01945 [Candidatus Delongbacteria bacterium]